MARKTPAGNLIFESAVHRSELVRLCRPDDQYAVSYITSWANQVAAIGSSDRISTTFRGCVRTLSQEMPALVINWHQQLGRAFFDGPTAWGELCTGAAFSLGLTKALLR